VNTKYDPLTEVIIHEISIFRSALEMAKIYTIGISHSHDIFKWASGVVMVYRGIDPSRSDIFSNEFLKGKTHWEWVSVAPMPKYSDKIKISDALLVPVKDVSYNSRFVEIGYFLFNKIQMKMKEECTYPYLVNTPNKLEHG